MRSQARAISNPPASVRLRIAEISLNRPDVSNSIDLHTARRLHEAILRADSDESAGAVLLRGEGRR